MVIAKLPSHQTSEKKDEEERTPFRICIIYLIVPVLFFHFWSLLDTSPYSTGQQRSNGSDFKELRLGSGLWHLKPPNFRFETWRKVALCGPSGIFKFCAVLTFSKGLMGENVPTRCKGATLQSIQFQLKSKKVKPIGSHSKSWQFSTADDKSSLHKVFRVFFINRSKKSVKNPFFCCNLHLQNKKSISWKRLWIQGCLGGLASTPAKRPKKPRRTHDFSTTIDPKIPR